MTVESMKLLKSGLEHMKQNLDPLGYLLCCMTQDVENLHSVVHYNNQVTIVFGYACDLGSTVKEDLKVTTSCSACYYISRGSWYPVPERTLGSFKEPSIHSATSSNQSHPQ